MTGGSEADRLFHMAGKDLAALEGMADEAIFSVEVFGFHAQQAAEKMLKAWLHSRKTDVPRTHDLRLSLRLLQRDGVQIEPLLWLVDLSLFAVQYRYEAYEFTAESIDRPKITRDIRGVFNRVERELATGRGGRFSPTNEE